MFFLNSEFLVSIHLIFICFPLELATKQEVKARPSKIVAGLEADKTNELLVAIAKAIDRKIDSTEAVALVKNGNVAAAAAAAPKKETKPTKTQTKTEPRKAKKETKEAKESSTIKKTKTTTDTKPTRKTESNAKVSKQSSKDSTDSKKIKRSPSQHLDKEKEREKDRKKERERTATIKTEAVVTVPKAVEQTIEIPQFNGIVVSEDEKNL